MSKTRKFKRPSSSVIRAAAKAPAAFAILAATPIELQAASIAEGQTPRFEIEAYNGGTLRVAGFSLPVVVDLASARFVEHQLPILFAHDAGQAVGHAESRVNTGTSIRLSGVLSVPGQRTNEIIAAHKSGYRWQASIGARDFSRQPIAANQHITVNGRQFVGPLIVARGATIYETSILPIGADSSTSVSIAAAQADTREKAMTFEKWIESLGLVLAELSVEDRNVLQASFDARFGSNNGAGAGQGQIAAGMNQGGQRVAGQQGGNSGQANGLQNGNAAANAGSQQNAQAGQNNAEPRGLLAQLADAEEHAAAIRAAAREYNAETIMVNNQPVNLVATALRENWSIDRVNFEAMRHQMSQHSQQPNRGPAIIVAGRSNPSEAGTVLEACLARQFNFTSEELEASYSAEVLEAADSRRFRSFTLHQLMDEVIRAAGHYYAGSRKSMEFVEAAANASDTLQASGTTTMSLSNIFENVLNKQLLAQFQRVATVWQMICGTRNLVDFKPAGFYRLNASGGFRKVGEDGELKHLGLSDAKSSVQADTYGLILSLTRQDIINDDLGALDQKAQIIGRLAAKSVEEAVFTLLLANTGSFFSAGNKNLITDVLAFAGLSNAVKTFAHMVDASGSPILVPPSILLTGSTLAETADSLYNDKEFAVGTSAKAQERINNSHKGRYKPVSTPYLDNTAIKNADGAAISNQGATKWLLLADPMDLPVIVVGFLNNRQVPYVESSDSVFNRLGYQTRAYFDWGIAFGPDKAAGVYSTGAG